MEHQIHRDVAGFKIKLNIILEKEEYSQTPGWQCKIDLRIISECIWYTKLLRRSK